MQTNINKPDSDKDVLLKMVDIEKSFPGVKALDHAQLTVRRGTVHALMGENGAGKSTLMKCLFGVYSKDGGHIYVDGQEVNYKNSKEALENGVAMVPRSSTRLSNAMSWIICGSEDSRLFQNFFRLQAKRKCMTKRREYSKSLK